MLIYESKGGIKVYAFPVHHEPVKPALGFRIEYRGRVVVISGDTRKSETIALNSRGADILIHEAYNRELVQQFLKFKDEMPDTPAAHALIRTAETTPIYHTAPYEAAQLAAQAGAKELVFTHIAPPMPHGLMGPLVRSMFMKGVSEEYHGSVVIAHEGMELTLDPR